jgi:hypothetical protein
MWQVAQFGRAPKNILVHTLPEKADELGLSPVKPDVASSNLALPPFIFARKGREMKR